MKHMFVWYPDRNHDDERQAYWTENRTSGCHMEISIADQDSDIYAIVGKYIDGYFICFPTLDAGCPLAGNLGDMWWNIPHLKAALNGSGFEWVVWFAAYALADMARYLGLSVE